jgi:hypothetical protein
MIPPSLWRSRQPRLDTNYILSEQLKASPSGRRTPGMLGGGLPAQPHTRHGHIGYASNMTSSPCKVRHLRALGPLLRRELRQGGELRGGDLEEGAVAAHGEDQEVALLLGKVMDGQMSRVIPSVISIVECM